MRRRLGRSERCPRFPIKRGYHVLGRFPRIANVIATTIMVLLKVTIIDDKYGDQLHKGWWG